MSIVVNRSSIYAAVTLPPSYQPRPGQVSDLRCTMRGATWLDLQWRTCDPEGAPVKECCVEVRWIDVGTVLGKSGSHLFTTELVGPLESNS